MKVNTKVRETPEQAAARQAEEQRIAAADAKTQAQEISSLRRLSDMRTRRIVRAFGARTAAAFGGGVGSPFSDAAAGVTAGGGGGGGGAGYGGFGGFTDFGGGGRVVN